jgi:arylsulfatase A-like enzyme
MSFPQNRPDDPPVWCVAGLLGLSFVFRDAMLAVRQSGFDGGHLSEWVVLALTGFLHALILALPVLLVAGITKKKCPVPLTLVLLAFSTLAWSLAGIWLLLPVYSARVLAVAHVLAALLAVGLLASAWRASLLRHIVRTAFAAHVAGIVMLAVSWRMLLHLPDPGRMAMSLALIWAVCCAVAAGGLALLHSVRARRPGLAAVLLVSVCLPPAADQLWLAATRYFGPPDGPKMVLFVADAYRADIASAYGGTAPTPALEEMGAEGAFAEWAFSLAPWTLPSMHGMFSSTYAESMPPGTTLDEWKRMMALYWLDQDTRTLSERLSSEGHVTGAYVANPVLRQPGGILRGFTEHKFWHWGYMDRTPAGPLRMSPFWHQLFLGRIPSLAWMQPADTSLLVTRHGESFLRRHGRGRFFLWLHYMDPHTPYSPPAKYVPKDALWPVFSPESPRYGTPQVGEDGFLRLNDAETRDMRRLYEGEIRHIDDQLARMRRLIDTYAGPDTFVVFTSDHGDAFGEHGRYMHDCTLYNDMVRVPMAITGPGVKPARVPTPVSIMDIMPTLAAFAGIMPDRNWKGLNLLPQLTGELPWEEVARPHFFGGTGWRVFPEHLQAVVAWPWKLIRGTDTGAVELYHLDEDPFEQTDVASENSDVADMLTEILGKWNESEHPFLATGADALVPAEAMDELMEALSAQGYLH